MTVARSKLNGNATRPDSTIDSSTSHQRLKHSTGPPTPTAEDQEQEDWDTANEGTVEGDGGADEEEDEDDPPMSPEDREQRRRLKGKAVEVAASDGDEDLPPNHHRNLLNAANRHRAVNGRPHPRHFSTPPPLTSSVQGSSAASSAAIVNGNRDQHHLPSSPPPPLRPPGPPRRSHSTPYHDEAEGQMLSAPAIPSVNVIPTSPPPHGRGADARPATGSLDIPHTLTESSSQESLRRRETLGTTSAATERRNNNRRSFDPRRGSNRLSGFFSNLLHLRDRSEPAPSEPPIAASPSPPTSTAAPRPSSSRSNVTQPGSLQPLQPLAPPSSESLQPVERPPTPPPALPAPTLQELGLQMTAITPSLTPPHFPCPPVSGVFLAPHYLLLCHNQGLDVMPLDGTLPPQPYALIRRVSFKSVLVMEERGVLVAIAGRREGVRVYSLDEVRKAVEWRMHAEMEKERERLDGLGGDWEHVQKAFFGSSWPVQAEDEKEDSPIHPGLPSKLSIDNPNDGPRLRGVSAPFVPTQPAQPTQDVVPSPRRRGTSVPPSPPPPYASLTPTASSSEPSSAPASNSSTTPTGLSQTTSHGVPLATSPTTLAVPEEPSGPTRERNASISTLSPPRPAHTVVPPKANDEDEPANEKGKGVDRTGGPLTEDEKNELDRTVESDDEALDPVAAGPSASAALDERTSAMAAAAAAAEAGAMVVSPVEPNNQTPSIRRPSVSASLSSRRQGARPSNLDLSPSALGAPSANLPVVASPAPTLRSMRQALSHSDTVRRPALAPRSPRASTSLSLSGVEDGTPDSPTEVGEDFISFAQALAESRLPSAPPLASRQNPNRSSSVPLVVKPAVPASSIISALAASRNSMPSAQLDPIMSARLAPIPTPPPVPPIPKETPQEAKKRRRFSMVPFSKASAPTSGSSNKNSRSSIMPLSAASASTPNFMEAAPSSAQTNEGFGSPAVPSSFSGPAEPLPPPSAPASVGHSHSNSSLAHGPSSSAPGRRSLMPGNTVDGIFSQTTPSSPMKTSRSATSFHSAGSSIINQPQYPPSSPPSPRASRRFLPKLFTGLKKNHEARNSKDLAKRQRSEAEKRLAAGGSASAAAMSAPMLGSPGPTVVSGRLNEAASIHMTIVQAPPPKLEYVKLPGTKGALAIKAVETAKKSFLAILCGEAGEKIELFAGTYRTALGLSRTFILPDSPRSLELQLQGDDLVELFLVFAQNVFALEPATVRVREVRINRAERRAARRRAREARSLLSADNPDTTPAAEEPSETIVTSIVTVGSDPTPRNRLSAAPIPGASPSVLADFNNVPPATPLPNGDGMGSEPNTAAVSPLGPQLPAGTTSEELAALAAVAQFGPYTTFQQLSYAPAFPLGTIADDYIIPPTYPDFLDYRNNHELDAPSIAELLEAPNTPPTLGPTPPAPVLPPSEPSPPPKWFYVDPKGVIQGPWKSALMQSWFDDGFLPPDLPVRRDTETEYTPLKVMCAAAKHPERPFRSPTPPPTPPALELPSVPNVLLHPISILAQPRRFGPPALFYTSRGGHSTSIVDSKGKSVLRGRINWTPDDETTRLGDVKRLEAFDTRNRAVLLAFRQGGIEVADVGDALCFPGDESRPDIPHFNAEAPSVSRRPPFCWKLGSQSNTTEQSTSSSDLHSAISTRENSKRSTLLSGRKTSMGPVPISRPASRSDGNGGEDSDGPLEEEVLYLGRHRDIVYFCERNAGSFRIISLGTMES
ncbi:hypothetical protein FRC04_011839 [Tulasnella sp. 424]|nr:hypothetical protein FRC04_011839 [Tulasnella sp. 424]